MKGPLDFSGPFRFSYRCGTPMGCGGVWVVRSVFTDVAPRWGALISKF